MDIKRFLQSLGVDTDAIDMAIDTDLDAKTDLALEGLIACAERWQGDTANDRAARAVLSGMRPLIDAMRETKDISPIVFQVAARQYIATVENLQALNALADLRDT